MVLSSRTPSSQRKFIINIESLCHSQLVRSTSQFTCSWHRLPTITHMWVPHYVRIISFPTGCSWYIWRRWVDASDNDPYWLVLLGLVLRSTCMYRMRGGPDVGIRYAELARSREGGGDLTADIPGGSEELATLSARSQWAFHEPPGRLLKTKQLHFRDNFIISQCFSYVNSPYYYVFIIWIEISKRKWFDWNKSYENLQSIEL